MRVISLSSRPAWRAAAASGLRSAAGSASRARLAAQNRPALRFPSAWLATHLARWLRSRPGAGSGWGRATCRCRFQQGGDGGPVQAAVGVHRADEVVGLAVDPGGRGQDVAAAGAEVQVVGGQVAVALVRAAEVGVQPAAGCADVRGRAVEQAGLAELGERGVAVAGRAVLVDVQDVGSGCARGDGQVPVRVAAEPGGDLLLVGGGVVEAVPGGGVFLPGMQGNTGQPRAA